MEANELRIGNYVIESKTNYNGISEKELKISIRDLMYAQYLKPITLTEDWLLKFELLKDGILFEKHKNSNFAIKMWIIGSEIEWIIFWGNIPLKGIIIKYVHQLQNLYYALTGEELILKS